MKVFLIDECDWVCARSEDEATEFYRSEIGISVTSIEECDITETGMWYGFDLTKLSEDSTMRIPDETIRKFLADNRSKVFKISNDPNGDFDMVVYLTFEEVFSLEQPEQPCVIATSEV